MPNWCNNTLTIYGPKEKIKKLAEAASRGELLETMVPIGEWDYNKAVEAWGTKWDVSEENGLEYTEIAENRASLSGWFDTAWGPPVDAYNTWLKENEDCDLGAYYYEPGMAFCGYWSNGAEEHYTIPETSVRTREEIPEAIDEEFGISATQEEWENEEDLSTWMREGADSLKLETA